jgi:hypothetical protein
MARRRTAGTLAMPARLWQRGIRPDAWRLLTDKQRREVIRTSDALVRPESARLRNVAERARRFAHVPEAERSAYWRKYDKGREEYEFWVLYKAFV